MHLVGDALLSSAATDRTGLGIGLLLSFLKQQVLQDLVIFSRFW